MIDGVKYHGTKYLITREDTINGYEITFITVWIIHDNSPNTLSFVSATLHFKKK